MKKILPLTVAILLLTVDLHSQEESSNPADPRFGLKAGYSSLSVKAKFQGISASNNSSGFYVGGFAEFQLTELFDLQPELAYARYTDDGESLDFLLLPVLLKYKPIQELGILAGPQFDYLLNEEDTENLKRLGFGMAIGLSYDITDHVVMDTRYVFGLSNRLEETELLGSEVKIRMDYVQVGLAYRF